MHGKFIHGKSRCIKESFFPAPPAANLSDLEGRIYPSAKVCPLTITKQEVLVAIHQLKVDKALGPNEIPNRILQACADKLSDMLTPLFQACIEQSYHLCAFKIANTIVMKKPPGKADYSISKGYRPIALLSALGKALESIMTENLTYLANTFSLLSDTQMGACRGKSTESALKLLTEQVHTVWGQDRDKVAILLSMDVSGTFDSVSHRQLIHNLRKRKILIWITKWVKSFLEDCKSTLAIYRQTTEVFEVHTGIPQGSPVSPILYLFYNADLLDICKRPGTRTSGLGFVNNVNILAYSTSIKKNCKTLERLHKECEKWANRHGVVFAPKNTS